MISDFELSVNSKSIDVNFDTLLEFKVTHFAGRCQKVTKGRLQSFFQLNSLNAQFTRTSQNCHRTDFSPLLPSGRLSYLHWSSYKARMSSIGPSKNTYRSAILRPNFISRCLCISENYEEIMRNLH